MESRSSTQLDFGSAPVAARGTRASLAARIWCQGRCCVVVADHRISNVSARLSRRLVNGISPSGQFLREHCAGLVPGSTEDKGRSGAIDYPIMTDPRAVQVET